MSGRSDCVDVPVATAPPALDAAEDAGDGTPRAEVVVTDPVRDASGTVPVEAAVPATELRVTAPVAEAAPLPTTIVCVETENVALEIVVAILVLILPT